MYLPHYCINIQALPKFFRGENTHFKIQLDSSIKKNPENSVCLLQCLAVDFEVGQCDFYNGVHVGRSVAADGATLSVGRGRAAYILYMEDRLQRERS